MATQLRMHCYVVDPQARAETRGQCESLIFAAFRRVWSGWVHQFLRVVRFDAGISRRAPSENVIGQTTDKRFCNRLPPSTRKRVSAALARTDSFVLKFTAR